MALREPATGRSAYFLSVQDKRSTSSDQPAQFGGAVVKGREIAAKVLAPRHPQLLLFAEAGQHSSRSLEPDASGAEHGPNLDRIQLALREAALERSGAVHLGGRPGGREAHVGIVILRLHSALTIRRIGDVQRLAPDHRAKLHLLTALAEIPPQWMAFLASQADISDVF